MENLYKFLKLLIIVLSLAVVLTGAWVLYDRLSGEMELAAPAQTQTQEATGEENPEPMPDFTVYDMEGNAHALSDFRGKPVILNFWASWCGPCRMEMPVFQSFYEAYGEQIHFLMVNLTDGYQETAESASAFLSEQGYTFPVYLDTDRDAAYKYGVRSVPVTYFADAAGNIIGYIPGALTDSMLQQGVELLLK